MLDERQILNLVANGLANSVGGNETDSIDANRKKALAAYLGQPNGKEKDGRSSVTSTDVADAIEWIMPEIVKAFTQNNQVVTFDPVGQGDEDQAELESDYVFDCLMKDNKGFIVLHELIKDALMQKNGFVKAFYEKSSKREKENYTGLTDAELLMLLSEPEMEIVSKTTKVETESEMQYQVHDVRVARIIDTSGIRVHGIPPEEIRISKNWGSIDFDGCPFSAHVTIKYAGDLVAQGYDKSFVDSIPTSDQELDDDTAYRFYMQGEDFTGNSTILDASLRPIQISECYMFMDIDEDGEYELVKVVVAGDGDELLEIEEIVSNPLISGTCILMSHKLFGLSIYDRLKEIQDQKTSIIRNMLDNMNLQNNQRTVVMDKMVNMDDVMTSRPGGIIRVTSMNAIEPLVTPNIGQESYQMIDYLDKIAAGRSGASADGPVNENMIGDRVGSEGVRDLISKKEEVVGLMIRVMAEVAIKPLCYKIRDLMVRHQDASKEFNYRGQWTKVNPSNWRNRSHTTVLVGTGSGDRRNMQSGLTQIMAIQEKLQAVSGEAMVGPEQAFKAINDLAKTYGLPGAGAYVKDPRSPQGQKDLKAAKESQAKAKEEEMKANMAMLESQKKMADAALASVKVDMENVILKSELEKAKNLLSAQEKQHQAQMAEANYQLAIAKGASDEIHKDKQLNFNYYQADLKDELERDRIASQERIATHNDNTSEE